MKLIQALKNLSEKLNAEFEDSKLFDHSGEKGEFREQIITELLRPFLPNAFGLGSGQIFDQSDKSSNQIDIVIFDAIYSNVLFKNRNNNLFPCESVYGEIEVKSNLTTDELNKSIDNIASLKKLNRADSTMLDISPVYKLKIGEGLKASNAKLNPYLGIIYAYDGLTKETFANKLDEKLKITHKTLTPDFIFNQKRQYMAIKVDKTGQVVGLGHDFERFGIINTNNDTLPIMFLTLNICLNMIRLKAPDYNIYWKRMMTEILENQ